MSTTVPLPSSGQFMESVRTSCKRLRLSANIQVKPEAINRLLTSPAFTDTLEKLKLSHGVAMPLKFPNAVAELNLLAVLALLNFGSGYRAPLHAATGRGAYDNIRALVLSMYLTSSEGSGPNNLLSAKGMSFVTREQIAGLMNVSLHVEAPHPTIPAVTVGQLGGPLLELVEMITKCLRDTGTVLSQNGYPDLGSFVMEALNDAKREGDKIGVAPLAEVVLEKFVRASPAFQDMAMVKGEPVYVFKKALFLVHAIALRFEPTTSDQSPNSIPIPDTTSLPVFADNVIPSMLVHLGVIDLSTASVGKLASAFPSAESTVASLLETAPLNADVLPSKGQPPVDGLVLTDEESYVLRAAAVDACQMIVEAVKVNVLPGSIKSLTLPELDGWLWAVAKDRPDYRRLPRFVNRPTIFF